MVPIYPSRIKNLDGQSIPMNKKKMLSAVLGRLERRYGRNLHTELKHRTASDLFTAVLLSPQCTDKQVNAATRGLFKKYKTFSDYANADPIELEKDLGGLNYYRTKAKHLRRSARMLVEIFDGKVPRTLAEMMVLPGVGRKVGNVVLNEMYGINEGIVVDTHCARVAHRLGLSPSGAPHAVECSLMRIAATKKRGEISNLFIALGRDVCHARTPACAECPLSDLCPSSLLNKGA
jgi:endonuclease-3